VAVAGTVIHGKNAAIYIDGVKVANKTEWSLSMTREMADVTTFRDANKVYAAGLRDINGAFSGMLDMGTELLMTKNDGNTHTVALYAVDGGTAIGTGPAFVDCNVTATSTDAVRITGTFHAAGDWVTTAP
jgi:hypothetical protein